MHGATVKYNQARLYNGVAIICTAKVELRASEEGSLNTDIINS